MNPWEHKRHALKSLELLKLALENARTATIEYHNGEFCEKASQFEIAINKLDAEISWPPDDGE